MTLFSKQIQLKDICEIKSGISMSRVRRRDVSSRDLTIKAYALSQKAFSKEFILDKKLELIDVTDIKKEFLTQKDDVIVKLSQPYESIYIDTEYEGILVTSSFAILRKRPDAHMDMRYIALFLNSSYASTMLKSATTGSSLQLLKRTSLGEINVPLISDEDQERLSAEHKIIVKLCREHRQAIELSETLLDSELDRLVNESNFSFTDLQDCKEEIQEEELRIQRKFNEAWAEFKKDKTQDSYRRTVVSYLKSLSPYLDAEYLAKPQAKEIQAAIWLTESSRSVLKFRYANGTPNSKNPDFIWEGKLWEIKRIESNQLRKVFLNAKRASEQSENIILDLSVSELSIDEASIKTRAIFEELPVERLLYLEGRSMKIEKR